jgi:hypothetical protein
MGCRHKPGSPVVGIANPGNLLAGDAPKLGGLRGPKLGRTNIEQSVQKERTKNGAGGPLDAQRKKTLEGHLPPSWGDFEGPSWDGQDIGQSVQRRG